MTGTAGWTRASVGQGADVGELEAALVGRGPLAFGRCVTRSKRFTDCLRALAPTIRVSNSSTGVELVAEC